MTVHSDQGTFFPRRLGAALVRAASQFPAVLLTGPRQSGKTTLLARTFGKTHRLVSFDDPTLRRFARDDPRAFVQDHPPPVVLDEVQYVPEIIPFVRLRIEAERDATGMFLLTGSQSMSLMAAVSEHLPGRCAILRLLPLSLAENPGTRVPMVADREGYVAWVVSGTFPELHRHPERDVGTWYASYLQTYLEREVRTLANVGNLRDFERLMALLAARDGGLLNLSALARDLGVAPNTVKAWLSVMEASSILHACPPYHEPPGKRAVRSPRLRFVDPGLVCRLAYATTAEQVLRGPLAGCLFEGVVAGEILRLMADAGEVPRLFHWRTVSGHEVDFIVEHGGLVHAVEAKMTANPDGKDVAGMTRFMADIPPARRGRAVLVCTSPHRGTLGGARVIPLWDFAGLKGIGDLLETGDLGMSDPRCSQGKI